MCHELLYSIDNVNVEEQTFRLLQRNKNSLTIISDADGDSKFTAEQLLQFAKDMCNWLNDNE